MTTEQAAPEVAQQTDAGWELPEYVREELTRLQGQRETLVTKIQNLRAQEADLAGQTN